MNFTRIIRCLCVLSLCLCALACDIERLIVWAPSGKTAAVLGEKGLYLCTEQGALTPLLLEDAKRVAWEKENVLLVAKPKPCTSWADLKPSLPSTEVEAIEQSAVRVKEMVMGSKRALKELTEDPQLQETMWSLGTARSAGVALLLLDDPDLRNARAAELAEHEKEFRSAMKYWSVERYALAKPGTLEKRDEVVASLAEIKEVVPAGDGRILFVADEGGSKEQVLWVAGPNGNARRLAERVSKYPCWSADRTSAFFMQANTVTKEEGALRLGTLNKLNVSAEKPEEATEELLSLVFDPVAKVRELAGGNLLFSGARVALPASRENMPQKQELMILDPRKVNESGGIPSVVRVEDEHLTFDAVQMFELSPDGTRVVLPGAKGAVGVVTIATGEVTLVTPENDENSALVSVPVWKGNEVCYAPGGESNNKIVVKGFKLWDGKATRDLSKGWPTDILRKPE